MEVATAPLLAPLLAVLQTLARQRALQAVLPAEEEAVAPPLSRQGQLCRALR